MPYIEQGRRDDFNVGYLPDDAGELNYAITQVILSYLHRIQHRTGEFKLTSYSDYNEVMGVLACVQQELYRRMVAPFEDEKCAENGDVYE